MSKVVSAHFTATTMNDLYSDIQDVLAQEKYARISAAEVIGILEFVKSEFVKNWIERTESE